jgi:hypothetical protein
MGPNSVHRLPRLLGSVGSAVPAGGGTTRTVGTGGADPARSAGLDVSESNWHAPQKRSQAGEVCTSCDAQTSGDCPLDS